MSVEAETIAVEVVADFVRIDYRARPKTAAGSFDLAQSVWVERASVPALVTALRTCIEVYATPEQTLALGHDTLKVYESGPEQEPYINVENERPDHAVHAGFFWIAMSKPTATELLSYLEACS